MSTVCNYCHRFHIIFRILRVRLVIFPSKTLQMNNEFFHVHAKLEKYIWEITPGYFIFLVNAFPFKLRIIKSVIVTLMWLPDNHIGTNIQ